MKLKNKEEYKLIDIFKLIFAFCVVGIHTGILLDYKIGYYLLTVILRLAVPFFFVISGYFLSKKINNDLPNKKNIILGFIKNTAWIYFILGSSYLILNLLKGNNFSSSLILVNLWQLFIGESWSVMWFCGASIISAIILIFIKDKKTLKYALNIALILYFVGLLFNTYNFLIVGTDWQFLYDFLYSKFGNNSNFLFVGFLYFCLGFYINENNQKIINIKNYIYYLLLIFGFLLLLVEVNVVFKHLNVVAYYEYYLSHLIIIPSLIVLILKSKFNYKIKFKTDIFRKLSTYIFYFHPLVLELIILYSQYKSNTIIRQNIPFYFITCFITLLISIIFIRINDSKSQKENKNDKIICYGLYLFAFIAIIFTFVTLFNKVIWVDEACSLAMIKHSFIDIIKLNSSDVHPPLYYILFKIFVDGINIIKSGLNPILLGKVFSIIPLFILILISFKSVKKRFGNLTASLFTVFLIGMPNMLQFFVEIRMYSWALLFVTISFIKMYDIIKENSRKDWILFVLFSLLAAYTHLYSCLAIVIMFVFLLIYFILKKDKKSQINWLIFGGTTLILYLPWIIQIVKQLTTVSSGFWIPPITFENCKEYLKFIFYSETNDRISRNIFGSLLILILIRVFYKLWKEKNDSITKSTILAGVLILGSVIGIGIVVSLLVSPVFIARYMYPALGVFWLAVSIGLSNYIQKNKFRVFVIFIPIFIATANLNNFMRYEINLDKSQDRFYEVQSLFEDDSILIANHGHIQLLTSYFHPEKKVYLYEEYNSPMIEELFGNIPDGLDINTIKTWIKEKKIIYFIELDGYKSLETDLTENKIKYINKGAFNEDWYQMNLYRIN